MTKLLEQGGQRYGWRGALVLPEEYFTLVSGPSFPSSASDSTFTGITTTTLVAITDVLQVSTNSAGVLTFSGLLSFEPATLTNGTYGTVAVWRYRTVGGSWVDATSDIFSIDSASVVAGSLDVVGSIDVAGSISLTANTDYEVQLYARRVSASPANTINFSGTASVSGSTAGYTITAAAGNFTYSGNNANVLTNRRIVAEQLTMAYAVSEAGLITARRVASDAGLFTVVYVNQTLLKASKLVADAVGYTFSGLDVGLSYQSLTSYSITADTGSFTASYQAANLAKGSVLLASPGAYSQSYVPANALIARVMTASPGTYLYSGAAAGTVVGRKITADAVSYSISPQTVNFYTARKVTADAASYALVGQTINLVHNKMLIAASASYNFTASDVALTYTAEVGVYNIKLGTTSASKLYLGSILVQSAYLGIVQVWGMSGAPASYTLTTSSGTYVISGQSNGLLKGSRTEAGLLGISVSGGPATLKMSRKLAAAAVGFILTGNAVTLVKSNSVTWAGYSTSSSISGTVALTFEADGYLFDGTLTNSWISTTPDATFASQHEIRWTSLTGSGFSSNNTLSQNTWYALTSPRTFSIDGTQGAEERFGFMTIEIRKIGTTTPVYSGVWDHVIVGST